MRWPTVTQLLNISFLLTCDEKVWIQSRKSTNAQLSAIVHLLSILCYWSCARVKHERWCENDTCSGDRESRLMVFLLAAIQFVVDKMFKMFRMQASNGQYFCFKLIITVFTIANETNSFNSISEWIEMFSEIPRVKCIVLLFFLLSLTPNRAVQMHVFFLDILNTCTWSCKCINQPIIARFNKNNVYIFNYKLLINLIFPCQ